MHTLSRDNALGQTTPVHHFTVDVEEHFQVSALEPYIDRRRWDRLPSRVVTGTQRLLDLLGKHGVRGTFFTLSWIASRYPALVRDIVAGGHELASHGSDHRRVTELEPHEFRASVRESKDVLEQIGGVQIIGYRAPSFSIVPGREWALDVLIEEGYAYDSSLYPVLRSGYGYPAGERHPYLIRRSAGELLEFPPATLRLFGRTLPAGGGAYLRLLPYGLVSSAFAQSERMGKVATFYVHPWEVDEKQPRFEVSRLTGIRHYGGLHRTLPRMDRLLSTFRFGRIADSVARESAHALATGPKRYPEPFVCAVRG